MAAPFCQQLRGDLRRVLSSGLTPSPDRSCLRARLLVPFDAFRDHRVYGNDQPAPTQFFGELLRKAEMNRVEPERRRGFDVAYRVVDKHRMPDVDSVPLD